MKKIQVLCMVCMTITGCQSRSTEPPENSVDENKIDTGAQRSDLVFDSLKWYNENQQPISADFYRTVFGDELSEIDKVFVSEIRNSVGSLNPVVTIFNTVESDQAKQYVDLHLFDNNWKLRHSVSLRYEVGYDLYSQDYEFVNDSVIQIVVEQGLGYDTDDFIRTMLTLQLKEANLLDTIMTKVDTVLVVTE